MKSMQSRYLEITYRRGRAIAAYFYLPRQPGDVSASTISGSAGLVTDFSDDGRAIGIEITSPKSLTLAALNEALAAAHQEPATPDDIAPLLAEQPARQPQSNS
jgi:hypothetical protein